MKTVNLFSGGLDSYIAAKLFEPDLNLYIDVNEDYSLKQIGVIDNMELDNVDMISMGDLRRFVDGVYLRHRNMLFITVAAIFGGDEIILSSTEGDAFPDKSRPFMDRLEEALDESAGPGFDYLVSSPFSELTKPEVVRAYKEKGFDMEELDNTTSCYGIDHECSECSSCLRRKVAFAINGHRVEEMFQLKDILWERLRSNEFSPSKREREQATELLCGLGIFDNAETAAMMSMYRY